MNTTQPRTFAGRAIEQWDRRIGVQNADAALRVSLDYDAWSRGERIAPWISALSEDPKAHRIEALVFGSWSHDPDPFSGPLCDRLATPQVASRLSNLRALFVGDINREECLISWLEHGDFGPVVRAYPRLECLQIRGGGVQFDELASSSLTRLVIETGGLPRECVQSVCAARLPNLEHLELWLGSEMYGADHTIDDLVPILSGRLFPKLRYLGLRDCEYTDEIARMIAHAPVLAQLDTLDLSMGTLGDAGAEALLSSTQLRRLATLDVSHHYLSDAVARRLAAAGPRVLARDPQGADAERYVQVAE